MNMAERQIPETNYLMTLVEKKFRKSVKTSTDFYLLAQEIESETNENVSASTLKRMWGYVNKAPLPRQTTLDVLAKYIGKKDYKTFCEDLKNSDAIQSMFFTSDFINVSDLKPESIIEIGWNPDRVVTLKHLGGSQFEVKSSINSQLRAGDRFEASSFIKGAPLYLSRIIRGDEFTSPYMAGKQGGLNHVKILQ